MVHVQLSHVQLLQFPFEQPSQLQLHSIFFMIYDFNVHIIDENVSEKMQNNRIIFFNVNYSTTIVASCEIGKLQELAIKQSALALA